MPNTWAVGEPAYVTLVPVEEGGEGDSVGNRKPDEVTVELADEEWEVRRQKRVAIVTATKASFDIAAYEATSEGSHVQVPDPEDRLQSKRAWERKVMKWRVALKEWKETMAE